MNIRRNTSLLNFNTFHLDMKADAVAVFQSVEELKTLLAEYKNSPILPLGEGSNILFTRDYGGLVLLSGMNRARALTETREDVLIEADAGLQMDSLIAQTVDMGLGGLENLSYIPGTVGAAAVQNVGAYGAEAKDVIHSVKALDRQTLDVVDIPAADCRYAYRYSRFKDEWKDRFIITSVVFRLRIGAVPDVSYKGLTEELSRLGVVSPSLSDVRRAVISLRQQKLPEVAQYGSAGSFFKNPIVSAETFAKIQSSYSDVPFYAMDGGYKIPAAWLIDRSGCKGLAVGGARVWDRQPLVIVNTGNATADDIMILAATVQHRVKQQFDIDLTPEVQYV